MDKKNKSAGWAIFAVTVAAIAATGYWAYKNKDKIKNLETNLNKFKGEIENWKQQKQEVLKSWQEDIEEFAETVSDKYLKDPQEAKSYLSETFSKKFNNAKKTVDSIKQNTQDKVSNVSNNLAQLNTAKGRKDISNLINLKKEPVDLNFGLNSRQEEIYSLIKKSTKATMQEFAEKIAGVTTRTLRRDLTKLQKLGLIEQVGKTKDSYYLIKK